MPANSTLLDRICVGAAHLEGVPGVRETLVNGDALHNFINLKVEPTSQMAERKQEGGFHRLPSIPEGTPGTATFQLEMVMDGPTAEKPRWADKFLVSCGMVYSTDHYELSQEPPDLTGTAVHTITIGKNENGRLKVLYGAMGNVKFNFLAAKRVLMDFEYTGVYDEVLDAAIFTPAYTIHRPLRFVKGSPVIGPSSWHPILASLVLDLGNVVYLKESGAGTDGYAFAVVTDRLPKITMNPEARLEAMSALYAGFFASTERDIEWRATMDSDSCEVTATGFQVITPRTGERSGVLVDEIEAQLNNHDLEIAFVRAATSTATGTFSATATGGSSTATASATA